MAKRKYVKENNLVKAINTDSLELQKPLVNEYYDVNVHNSNMDKIDKGYKQNKNDISDIKNELSITENTSYTTANGIKEFECKDGYVDNVVIEGQTKILNAENQECEAGVEGAKLVSVGQGDKIEVLTKNSDETKQDKKQILTTLRSLPNGVKDTIEKRGNKYYKIKRCGEVVLNGGENWSLINTRTNTITFGFSKLSDMKYVNDDKHIISDKFISYSDANNTVDVEKFWNNQWNLFISINKTKLSAQTLEGFKTWLSQNPVTVVYELETPIIEELPNFNPQTFSDKTTLLLNSGVVQGEASFEVTNSMGSELEVLKCKFTNIEEDYLSFVRKYNDEKFIQHYQVGSDGDFNNLVESGFYKIQTTTTNLPNGAYQYGMLLVFRYTRDNEKRTIQIYIPNTSNSSSGGIYTRSYNSGRWSSWFKSGTPIATLSNLEVQISELEIQLLESGV